MKVLFTILCFVWVSGEAQNMPLQMQLSERILYSPPAITYDTIQVNNWDSLASPIGTVGRVNDAAWNEWYMLLNGTEDNRWSKVHNWTTGISSGISTAWRLSSGTTRAISGYVNNYNSPGSPTYSAATTTNFPPVIFQIGAFTNGNNNTRLLFQGCDDAKSYRLEAITSRATSTDVTATWASGAVSQSVQPRNNINTVVVLDNISSSGGILTITITYTSSTFAFINGFRLIQKTVN